MKLKGRKKLNKTITAAVREMIGDENIECRLDNEWSYYADKVRFTIITNEESDRRWCRWMKSIQSWNGSDLLLNMWMLALLHEIGHHMTIEYLKTTMPMVYNSSRDEEDEINTRLRDETDPEVIDKLNIRYHALPHEFIATNWAFEFYEEEPEKVEACFNKIAKAVVKFYAKNGLDENGEEVL